MADVISGIKIPDSKIAREAAELVRHVPARQSDWIYTHGYPVLTR